MANATQELVVSGVDEATINRIDSFQAAFAAFSATDLKQEDMLYQASPYPLLEDKNTLVGVPFIITQVKWGESKKFVRNGESARFVILYIVTEGDELWTVTDGSTGIADQVQTLVADRQSRGVIPADQGIYVKNGLTRSDYDYTDEKGNVSPATTFYLG